MFLCFIIFCSLLYVVLLCCIMLCHVLRRVSSPSVDPNNLFVRHHILSCKKNVDTFMQICTFQLFKLHIYLFPMLFVECVPYIPCPVGVCASTHSPCCVWNVCHTYNVLWVFVHRPTAHAVCGVCAIHIMFCGCLCIDP